MKIDNSSLLKYEGGADVKLTKGNESGTIMSPEWVKSLIMVELRCDMASIGGTMPESKRLLDFYAETGVNGLWLCPIYRRNGGNGYGNIGPHEFEPSITGSDTVEGSLSNIAEFVKYAHSKGIYVFFDVITWGVLHKADLVKQHPAWFDGEKWGGAAFDWQKKELSDWFVSICVRNILETDADGFRCDCEPFTSGYEIFGRVRQKLAEQGKYIAIISEDGSDRSRTYDFEQDGVLDYSRKTRGDFYEHPVNFYTDGYLDIVDSVKNGKGIGYQDGQKCETECGTGRFYTHCLTNHDFCSRNVHGDRVKIGYTAIFAPYIPLWYMGDEFNADTPDGVQYFQKVDYAEAEKPGNKEFFEDVKKYIQIRRTHREIYETWPMNHRDSNIVRVQVDGEPLTAYARYAGGEMIIVVPKTVDDNKPLRVYIPKDCGLKTATKYSVEDLMSGSVIECDGTSFDAEIAYRHIGVYKIK